VSVELRRCDYKREDGYSSSLQIGKAAEHLVCGDLLLGGWEAMLADAGVPYDIIVDLHDGRLVRVQVKGTLRLYRRKNPAYQPSYRFMIRKSRTKQRRSPLRCDVVALVALDIRKVAYLPASRLIGKDGLAVSVIDMKTRDFDYQRLGKRGVDPRWSGRFLEDHADFGAAVLAQVEEDR